MVSPDGSVSRATRAGNGRAGVHVSRPEIDTMRRWFTRFGFSFILLSIVFAWEGYRIQRGDYGAAAPQWKAYALFTAAAVCFGLGVRAVRERHRVLDEYRGNDDRDRDNR